MMDAANARSAGAATQLAWTLAALIASVALAVAAAWPIYETPRTAVVAAGGLLIGAGAALGAKLMKWRWWSAAGLGLVGYTVAVVPLAVPTAMTDTGRIIRGVVNGLAGIVTGWKELLTVSLPAGTYQGVLVPFLVVVVAGSLATVLLATSGKRTAPWAVMPMLGMVIFGAVFGSASAGTEVRVGPVTVPAAWHVVIGTLALIVASAWLVGRARIERAIALRVARSKASTVRQSGESLALTVRRHLVAGALVLVALAAGVAASPVAASFGPRDALREAVDPVLILKQQPSPLSGYRNSFTTPGYDAELFTVEGADGVDRIRIVTLDAYDGQTFHVGDEDRSALFSREPGLQSAHVQITIGAGYEGIWVPVVDALDGAPQFGGDRAEELGDAYYASHALDAGVLVTADAEVGIGLLPGDRYSVGRDASTGTMEALASSTGRDPLISAEDYPALAAWVEEQAVGRTGNDLAELVTRLRDRGYLSHSTTQGAASAWVSSLTSTSSYVFAPSRSGHSAARIDELFAAMLEQERRAGADASADLLVAAVGDDEQFAAASALLARYLGFESRVVIGVRLGTTPDGAGVPSCQTVCTGANLTAWTEVRAGGGRWVVLDSSPQYEVIPTRIKEGERQPENPTEVNAVGSDVLEPPSTQSDTTETTNTDPLEDPEEKSAGFATLVTVLTAVLAVALIVLPILVFPVAKAMRRGWRRHSGVAEVSMVGAWDELLDTYVDLGIEIPRGLTRAELADVLDRPAAVTLAAIVDRAVFAEHSPTAEASQATWGILTEERRAVAAEAPFRHRARSILTPASFIRTLRAQRHAPTATRLAGRTHHDL
jgi:hypothetical protein